MGEGVQVTMNPWAASIVIVPSLVVAFVLGYAIDGSIGGTVATLICAAIWGLVVTARLARVPPTERTEQRTRGHVIVVAGFLAALSAECAGLLGSLLFGDAASTRALAIALVVTGVGFATFIVVWRAQDRTAG